MLTKIKQTVQENKAVFQNLSYLSFLQVFNMLVPLIVYPYLIRVLGKETYGLVIFAQAVVLYFCVLINFGFSISATKSISTHRNNKEEINQIVSNVFVLKGLLFLISIILFSIILNIIPQANEYTTLFYLTLYLCVYEWLFPLWFFQGIEEMKYITILNVLNKIIFLVLVFVLITSADDYLLYPIISAIGGVTASVIAIGLIIIKYEVRFILPTLDSLKLNFKESIPIFISNLSVRIYAGSNRVIVGALLGMTEVAYYDLAEKITNLLRIPQGILTQVLFPKISHDKDISFVKSVFKKSLFAHILAYFLLLVFHKKIILLLGGSDMLSASPALLILSFTAPLIVLTTVFGTQLLLPFGYNKIFSKIAVMSTFIYFLIILFLYTTVGISIINISFATVLAIIFEAVLLFLYCKKLKLWK